VACQLFSLKRIHRRTPAGADRAQLDHRRQPGTAQSGAVSVGPTNQAACPRCRCSGLRCLRR
jgi:hypothetical protein